MTIKEDLEKIGELTDEYNPNQYDNTMEIAYQQAQDHVSWFVETLRPLLISHMVHGFKHGIEFQKERQVQQEEDDLHQAMNDLRPE